MLNFCLLVHHTKLEELVDELSSSLNSVKREQEFMEVRERIHRASEWHEPLQGQEFNVNLLLSVNENTNTRVVLWSCFEAFILLTMAFGQVYYLKKFFEVRRVV